MKNKLILLILPILILGSGFIATGDSNAQGTPVIVRIQPSTIQVGVGQTVDLAVEVVSVEELYGFDVDLSFNPDVVEVVDADLNLNGVQVSLGTFLDSGFVIINQADNVSGSVRFATTQLNPSPAQSGTGNLIVVRFKGKQANLSSEIKLNKAQIAKPNGDKIPTSPTSGQIQVVETIPGPTNTGIPTQGVGTPMPPETTEVPLDSTATKKSTSFFPTSQPTPTSASMVIPSVTTRPPATVTGLSPAITPTAYVLSSATRDDLPTTTSIVSTQNQAVVATPMMGYESTRESTQIAASYTSTVVSSKALPSEVTVILQTQSTPSGGLFGNILVAVPIFGLFVLIGLAAILLIYILLRFIKKR